ncbi:hypothetical protein C2G38_2160658 [Gigaspora rosea]|uniref:Uncharacterized protein n=1 Tax=Gigaspora rosea TaxID=44941 RepID=A0A397VXY7_9GLOM|nr:hypothetical protein C2G38_2160658 [Gigaspora rosea]
MLSSHHINTIGWQTPTFSQKKFEIDSYLQTQEYPINKNSNLIFLTTSMENNTNSKASDEPTNHVAITLDMFKIDGNTKDAACQNSANIIIVSIRALFDQHAATQSAIINKLNTCIDQCFKQLQTQQSQQQHLKLQETHDTTMTWT